MLLFFYNKHVQQGLVSQNDKGDVSNDTLLPITRLFTIVSDILTTILTLIWNMKNGLVYQYLFKRSHNPIFSTTKCVSFILEPCFKPLIWCHTFRYALRLRNDEKEKNLNQIRLSLGTEQIHPSVPPPTSPPYTHTAYDVDIALKPRNKIITPSPYPVAPPQKSTTNGTLCTGTGEHVQGPGNSSCTRGEAKSHPQTNTPCECGMLPCARNTEP